MKKSALFVASFSLFALLNINNAHAEWKELGSNEFMVLYADLDTIRDFGEKAQIMSMLDFKKSGVNPKNKKKVNSIVGLNEYNCPGISYRPISFKEFSGNKGTGSVVSDNSTPDSQFEPIVNGDWTAGVFNLVCVKK